MADAGRPETALTAESVLNPEITPIAGGEASREGDSGSERGVDRETEIDPAVATTAREELRTTFAYQVERLREIDTQAIEILKANPVLIGIVVTGGSIVVQTEFDLGG